MKRWAATVPFLLLIACGDDPTAPVDYLATSYVLTSANGQSLPAEVDGVSADGGTTVSEITSGQLSFSGEDEISMEFQIIARFKWWGARIRDSLYHYFLCPTPEHAQYRHRGEFW